MPSCCAWSRVIPKSVVASLFLKDSILFVLGLSVRYTSGQETEEIRGETDFKHCCFVCWGFVLAGPNSFFDFIFANLTHRFGCVERGHVAIVIAKHTHNGARNIRPSNQRINHAIQLSIMYGATSISARHFLRQSRSESFAQLISVCLHMVRHGSRVCCDGEIAIKDVLIEFHIVLRVCLVVGAEASSFNTCLGMVQEEQSSLPTYSGRLFVSCLKDAHGANRQPHCLQRFHPHRRRTQQERHLADQLQAYEQNQSHRQRGAWKDVAQLRCA